MKIYLPHSMHKNNHRNVDHYGAYNINILYGEYDGAISKCETYFLKGGIFGRIVSLL